MGNGFYDILLPTGEVGPRVNGDRNEAACLTHSPFPSPDSPLSVTLRAAKGA